MSCIILGDDFSQDSHTTMNQCWSTVYDAGPTLNKHWLNVSCLLAMHLLPIPGMWICLTYLDTRGSSSKTRHRLPSSQSVVYASHMSDTYDTMVARGKYSNPILVFRLFSYPHPIFHTCIFKTKSIINTAYTRYLL